MLGVAAQRIAWPIRKPRNNADECHCAETRRDGAFRAICVVAPLARGACHGRRVASRISSRKASVAATRGLFRGSLGPGNVKVIRCSIGNPCFLADLRLTAHICRRLSTDSVHPLDTLRLAEDAI